MKYRFKEIIIHSFPDAYNKAKEDMKKFQEEGYEVFAANGVYAPNHTMGNFEQADYVMFYFLRKPLED